MPYPPQPPTATRTNSTLTLNNHPNDHNALASGMSDIVNELGSGPKAADADLTARLLRIETELAAAQRGVGEFLWLADDQDPTAPGTWVKPEGQTLIIADHDDLYQRWGTDYGGDGVTTFGVPDLRDRFIAAAGGAYAVGEEGGSADAVAVNHGHADTFDIRANTGTHGHDEGGYSSVANDGFLYRQGDGANGWETLNGSGNITKSYEYPQVQAAGSGHDHPLDGSVTNLTGEDGVGKNTPLYFGMQPWVRVL